MKKRIYLLLILAFCITTTHAQTKIKDGTISSSPLANSNAILELESNNKGLLLPRLNLVNTTNAAPLASHIGGMIVYNTVTTGDVVPGVYYNNGTKWNLLSTPPDISLYNSNGSLTSHRTVTLNNHTLEYSGSSQRTLIGTNGGLSVQAINGGTRASIGLYTNGTAQSWWFTDNNNTTQFVASNNSTALLLGTNANSNPAPIIFSTSTGSGASGSQRARIEGDGRFTIISSLAVGWGNAQTFTGDQKLKVNGSIVAAGTTFPDYVFEDYFNGKSTLNKNYKFLTLHEIEEYIKKHNHLPGIAAATALEKTDDGKYIFNVSELSLQSLEKIEELYLHTIAQQKEIDQLKQELLALKQLIQQLPQNQYSKN